LVADKTLDRGAAIFETNRGNLDASAETQLLEIEQGLTDRLRGSS
jgi:flagellar biosynthesis/type III secretory pathway protein FliH